MKKKLLILAGSLLLLTAGAVFVATQNKDLTADEILLMRNVEALAYDEGVDIAFAEKREEEVAVADYIRYVEHGVTYCKIDVYTTLKCIGSGWTPCREEGQMKSEPYNCLTVWLL